jgi:drug/metabolite transporter (DMT)-like permease
MKASPIVIWGVLGCALIVISFASIWIRWAEAPPISIAAYRVGLAAFILTPIALSTRRQQLQALSRSDLRYALLGGVCLALHFIFWISSLEFTSVASSVVLVTTNPIFVALGSYFLLKEPVTMSLIVGIAISLVGGVLIGYGIFSAGPNVLLGDGLALLGAVMASAYLLVGRRLRAHTDLLTYIFLVYGAAAIVLLATALLLKQPLAGFPQETYLLVSVARPSAAAHRAHELQLGIEALIGEHGRRDHLRRACGLDGARVSFARRAGDGAQGRRRRFDLTWDLLEQPALSGSVKI